MNKFFGKIYKWLYAIPFGLKGFEEVVAHSNGVSDGSSINVLKEADDERVGEHLLKGEVTQSVEDLRWRTYTVDNEAKKYTYIGNGVALKEEPSVRESAMVHKFSMENKLSVGTISDGVDAVSKPVLEVVYKSFVRFKLEKYVSEFDVDINEGTRSFLIALHFSKHPNPNEPTSKMFINELQRIASSIDTLRKSEVFGEIECISFSTYKAKGEEDFVIYTFNDGCEIVGLEETSDHNEYVVTLRFNTGVRIPRDFGEIYYSEHMAKKYANKELRETPIDFKTYERKHYCSVCGKEISVYDGDILTYEGIGPVCTDCLKKINH